MRETDKRKKEKRKDYYKELDRERYYRNRDSILDRKKEYYSNNREIILAKESIYRETKEGRANNLCGSYRQDDKLYNRGDCTLTKDWIIDNIFNTSCVYCGESDWRKLGCDRIDNTKAHTPENVVCACVYCNSKRGDRYSVEEFKLKKQQELNLSAKA